MEHTQSTARRTEIALEVPDVEAAYRTLGARKRSCKRHIGRTTRPRQGRRRSPPTARTGTRSRAYDYHGPSAGFRRGPIAPSAQALLPGHRPHRGQRELGKRTKGGVISPGWAHEHGGVHRRRHATDYSALMSKVVANGSASEVPSTSPPSREEVADRRYLSSRRDGRQHTRSPRTTFCPQGQSAPGGRVPRRARLYYDDGAARADGDVRAEIVS